MKIEINMLRYSVMDKCSIIEREEGISLPAVYKEFYKRCACSMPENLIGTDLRNGHAELNRWATELLEANGVENFLDEKDFVFMLHQGYIFWYFKADGHPDPFVYGYQEGKLKPDNFGCLSAFIAAM